MGLLNKNFKFSRTYLIFNKSVASLQIGSNKTNVECWIAWQPGEMFCSSLKIN